MDYHKLKRKELQDLCKKHKIPANLTNLEMADRLTALLAVKEKPLPQGQPSCLKSLDENMGANDSDVRNRPAKKVRFSPQNEMIEFQKSEVRYIEVRDRGTRKSVLCKDKDGGLADTINNDGVAGEVGEPRKSSRGSLLVENEVKTKGGKRAVNIDVLRDNNDITGDATNGEVREVRRSRRGKLLEETKLENRGEKTSNVEEDNSTFESAVNGEIRELRRSRRGKLSEGTEFQSKEGKGAAKVVAFTDDNQNTNNPVTGEAREVRRSRRGKKLEGAELQSRVESATKIRGSEDTGTTGDLVNGEDREVRRFRRGKKLSEGSKVESKGGKGVTKAEALNDNNFVDDVLDGDHSEVRISRRNKFQEHCDVSKDKLSAAGDVPSVNVQHEELPVVNKHLSSKRELLDEKSRENEGGEKISRNLLPGEMEDCEDEVGKKEVATESASVQLQAGVRRSSRHLAKVDYVQLVSNKLTKKRNVVRGRPRSKTALGPKEISGDDNISEIVVVDKHAWVEANPRRLQENASKLECSASAQGTDVVAPVKNKKETQKRRRDVGLEGKAAMTDEVKPIAETVNIVQKEKGLSKTTNVELKDSVIVDTTATDPDAQASSTDTDPKNCTNAKLRSNAPEVENTIPAESNFLIDGLAANSNAVNDCCPGAIDTSLRNSPKSKQEEFTTAMHSAKTVNLNEEVSPILPSCSGPLYLSPAVTNSHSTKICSFKDPKPDENNGPNVAQVNSPDAFKRSASRTLLDGCSNSVEDIVNPCDMPAVVLQPSAKAVERTTEFSGSTIVVSPKSLCTFPLNGAMDLELHFERSRRLPTEKSRDVKPGFDKVAEEAPKATDLERHLEMSGCVETDQSGFVETKCDKADREELRSKEGTPSEMCAPTPVELNRDVVPEYKNVAVEALIDVELKPTQLSSCHEPKFDMAGEAFRTVDLETDIKMSTKSPTEQSGCVETDCDKIVGEALKGLETPEFCTELRSRQCVESDCSLGREAIKVTDLETHLEMCTQSPAEQSKVGPEFKKVTGEAPKAMELKTPIEMSPLATKESGGSEPEFDIAWEELKYVDLETHSETRRQIPTEQRRDVEGKVDIAGEVLKAMGNSESSTGKSIVVGSDLDFEGEATVQSRNVKLECHGADGETVEAEDFVVHLEMTTQSINQQSKGVEPEVCQDGHAADSCKHEDVGLDCSFEPRELNSPVGTINAMLDNIDPGDGNSKTPGLLYNKTNDAARTNSSFKEQDLPGDGDGIAVCDVESNSPVQGTQIVVGWESTEFEQGFEKSCTGSNSPQKSSPLNHLGYGVPGEVNAREENLCSEVNETPGGDDAEIEECIIPSVKHWNALELVDQPELMTKVRGKETSGCEAAASVEIPEANNGHENPINTEKGDSNELQRPNDLIDFTEGHKLSVDGDDDGKKAVAQEICSTNAVKELNAHEPNNLFGIPITSFESDSVQVHGSGALCNSVSHVATAEDRGDLISKGSESELLQLDEQKISDLSLQGTVDVGGEETSKDDELAESGNEVLISSLEIKIPLGDIKGGRSIPFDDIKLAGEEKGTSLAMLFETPIKLTSTKAELRNSDIGEHATSESSVTKHPLVFQGSEVAGSGYCKVRSIMSETPNSTFQGNSSTAVEGFAPLIQSDASNVKVSVAAGKDNTASDKGVNPGKATNFVKLETKSVSGAAHHHPTNADKADFVCSLVSDVKTDSIQSGKSVAAAGKTENINLEVTIPPGESTGGDSFPFDDFKLAGEEKGTSLALLFETPIKLTSSKAELMNFDIGELAASESSVTKHSLVFQGSNVAGSEYWKIPSIMSETHHSTFQSNSTEFDGFIPLVQSEASYVELPVAARKDNSASDKEADQGKATNFTEFVTESVSGAAHQCPTSADRDLVHNLVSDMKTDSIRSGKSVDVAGKTENISLEIKIPPGGSKGGDSFPFDDFKLTGEEKGTSLALLFGTPNTLTSTKSELMNSDIGKHATSKSSVTKHPLVFQGSEVAGFEYWEISSIMRETPQSTFQGNSSTEVEAFVPLIQSDASNVEVPVAAGKDNTASDEEVNQGKATNFVKLDTKSVSGAAHQCPTNADGDPIHNLVSDAKTDSIQSGKSVAVAGKTENISLEIEIPPGESNGGDSFPFDDFELAGEEKGTSLAMLFETPIKLISTKAELMNSDIAEHAASESSVTNPLVFHEREVASSEYGEILSMMFENPDSTSLGNLLREDKGYGPSVQSNASDVEDPVAAGKDKYASDKKVDLGKATNLVKSYTKSVSGAAHQHSGIVHNADLECDLVSDAKTNSLLIGKSVDVAEISLEIEIPPGESKGGDSFLFDDIKLAGQEKGTSLSMLFETPIKLTCSNAEPMASDIWGCVASESSVTKHPLVFQESEVAGSEYGEIPSMMSQNPDSSLQGNLLTEVKGFVPLAQSLASNVQEAVVAVKSASHTEADEGKATNLVKRDHKSVSGVAHQRPTNSSRDLESNSVSNMKANSIRTGNSAAVAGKSENISTAAKSTIKKKDARTILIHATPKKLQLGADMKENATSSKLGKVGSLTTMRPGAKRPPLKHISPWK
ncbi:OLC1v1017666C1 [Oldenlandia corymbosa var. corymbosa]|uniref:OLC1v1017666C1 n=1 Tax=Oldenlandia corymbosa var. corymbosa TaxID=529605 RepID=A0AAV1EA08_OLDCO|nr:OLC1v1017666C1 [Oldenlandia corymbosa var. corymbosa]